MIGIQLAIITGLLAAIAWHIVDIRNVLIDEYYEDEPDPYDFKNEAFYKLRKKWDK